MKELIERILNSRLGEREHIVGSPVSKSEKAKVAAKLGQILRGEENFFDEYPNMAAAEELVHAINYIGPCDIGYSKNIFNKVTRSFVRIPKSALPEQIYLSAMAGCCKKNGRIKYISGIPIPETMISKEDLKVASKAAEQLTTGQIQNLNKLIFGKYYDPLFIELFGFVTKDNK